ncbi:hypothetical protein ACLBVB_35360, partial [Pseudomonas aeruginosa]
MSLPTGPQSRMFYDYLTVEQVYSHPLPKVSDTGICYYDRRTGETIRDTAPGWKHEGSYSTLINRCCAPAAPIAPASGCRPA